MSNATNTGFGDDFLKTVERDYTRRLVQGERVLVLKPVAEEFLASNAATHAMTEGAASHV